MGTSERPVRLARQDVRVAIVFELVVNFGLNDEAVVRARAELDRTSVISLRGVHLALTPPFVRRLSAGGVEYIEYSVHPRGLGYGGPGPKPSFEPSSVTDDELTDVGRQLYALLKRFDGYQAAMVGWDPEGFVDLSELEADWVADGSIASLDGLVISSEVADRWGCDAGWAPFDLAHVWRPYSGSRNAPHW